MKGRRHGQDGVYQGGEWVDIEDLEVGGCEAKKKVAASSNDFDIVVIGGGAVGCALVRELSRFQLKTALIEAADDVAQGSSKGNSGIIHAGYDDEPGSVKSRYCWPGNQMFSQLDNDLRFGFHRNGSLVIATNAEEQQALRNLLKRGHENGVANLRIVEREELRQMEPHLSDQCIEALYSPDAGVVSPYEYCIALAENAVENGVEFRLRHQVVAIDWDEKTERFRIEANVWEPPNVVQSKGQKPYPPRPAARGLVTTGVWDPEHMTMSALDRKSHDFHLHFMEGKPVSIEDMKIGGSGSCTYLGGQVIKQAFFTAGTVINAGGCNADKISAMIGDESFKILPRLGDYILLNKSQGHLATRTLFPAPSKLGKGVLVQTTLWGNLILGPTARDEERYNQPVDEIHRELIERARLLVPAFEVEQIFHSFTGARAKSSRGDWIIEPSAVNRKFINVCGIDSPGLASSPAIAQDVVHRLLSVDLVPKDSWNPFRQRLIRVKEPGGRVGGRKLKYSEFQLRWEHDAERNVVCKCERVTEDEVIGSLKLLPVSSTQSVRKRVRAGMGPCQSNPRNYACERRVAEIIARQRNIPLSAVSPRPWPATSSLGKRWLTKSQKKKMFSKL